jgi:hypothetical protein
MRLGASREAFVATLLGRLEQDLPSGHAAGRRRPGNARQRPGRAMDALST